MGFLSRLFARKSPAPPGDSVIGYSLESYALKCRQCGFTHRIPKDCRDPDVSFFVTPAEVKLTCIYGGRFTVTLEVKDFFSLQRAPASGQVVQASIGPNMRPLHQHMLTHFDPLFLIIRQSPNQTTHTYKMQAEGSTYVKFSKTRGVDIVGNINVGKAEIPGISD